ncbi:hypothetical protein [Thermosinus carboxydivorans]|uniref:hypothetical protein n=1 Tax=Thermosinus carboxydivorans TaxID=261685 RepID=UPI00030E32A4|nr:hypothetical protein [Thermosinus carboxydivorans]
MVANQDSFRANLRDLVQEEGLPLTETIQVVTANVAKALKQWPNKGSIQVGLTRTL